MCPPPSLGSPLPTALCHSVLTLYLALPQSLTPSFRGWEAPEPPVAEGSHLSERAAHCHYFALRAGPLLSSSSSASASVSDRAISPSLGFPICAMGNCIGWCPKALSAPICCESRNLDMDLFGVRLEILTWVPRSSCWDAGSSACPSLPEKSSLPDICILRRLKMFG